jgi:hypothetical protein
LVLDSVTLELWRRDEYEAVRPTGEDILSMYTRCFLRKVAERSWTLAARARWTFFAASWSFWETWEGGKECGWAAGIFWISAWQRRKPWAGMSGGKWTRGGRTRVMSVVRASISCSSRDRSENPGRTCFAWRRSRAVTGNGQRGSRAKGELTLQLGVGESVGDLVGKCGPGRSDVEGDVGVDERVDFVVGVWEGAETAGSRGGVAV